MIALIKEHSMIILAIIGAVAFFSLADYVVDSFQEYSAAYISSLTGSGKTVD